MPRKKKTEDVENTISAEKEVKEEKKNTTYSAYGWEAVQERAKLTIK